MRTPYTARGTVRFVALLLVLGTGCRNGDPPAPAANVGPAAVPTPVVVRDGDPSLLFSYREAGGTYATAARIDEVPESARDAVVVIDLDQTPEERRAGRFIHVADLRKAGPDGHYPVAVQSRYAFEAPAEASTNPTESGDGVVMYSASWCGVCAKAKRLLDAWKVPFVEKDVEASRAAARELAAKAAQRGFAPGGVPVIDVRGVLLRGLDEGRLKATLQEQGLLPSP